MSFPNDSLVVDAPNGPDPRAVNRADWHAVAEALARKYPAVPLPVVAREVTAAVSSDRVAGEGPARVIAAIADSNIAAIADALAQGATLAGPDTQS